MPTLKVWNGSEWEYLTGGAAILQQDAEPGSPVEGDLWIDTDAEPSGSTVWDLVQDLPGTTATGWTANGGTWSADAGGFLKQTGTGVSYSGFFLDADVYPGSVLVLQAEIRLPSAGQPAGTPRRAMLSMAATNSVSGNHNPWGGIQKGADGVMMQRGDQAVMGPVSTTVAYDTWYTVRLELNGGILTVSQDGARQLSYRLGQGAADVLANKVGLVTYQAVVHYRNIKVWRMAAPT